MHGASAGASPSVQGEALRRVIHLRERVHRAPLNLAMVYPFSCHNYELRYWLSAAGINPDQDVRLLVLPPPLLVDALREGQIDGFCVGEPWNSLAVAVGVGSIVASTSAIWRLSPEKVLGCRLAWAQRHPDRLLALIRALYRAAVWCENPEHHEELSALLSQPRYVGAPAKILQRGLSNKLVLVPETAPRAIPNFYVPAKHAATFPWTSHALWFYSQMVRWRQVQYSPDHLPSVRATYRPDLYRLALEQLGIDLPLHDTKVEGLFTQSHALASTTGVLRYGPDGFFDGRNFDADNIVDYAAEPETTPDLGRTAVPIL
jgi:two-component system, oxyanion-binding sensor